MNILDPFRRFIFTHLDFNAFSMDKCNTTVKTISYDGSDFMATAALTVALTLKTTVHLKNIQNSHQQFISIRILIRLG